MPGPPMHLRHLRTLADCPELPWKNGGGITRELWIHPADSSLASGFQIRLSVAEVRGSGPFSPFPGIDRTLLLLEGGGVELSHGVKGSAFLSGPFHPVVFSGEWETRALLKDGPCRDFNVMTDRGAWKHRVEVLRPGDVLVSGVWSLIYAARGPLTLEGAPLTEGSLWETPMAKAEPLNGHPDSVALQVCLWPV